VDISSVDNQRKVITEARPLPGKAAPSRARQVIRTNDVLVATTRPNLNAVALVPPDLDNQITSTGFCVLRSNGEIEPEYLFAFVRTPAFVRSLSDLVKGALYPAVTDGQVRAQRLPLPPLPDQRRVAARLREQLSAVAEARAAVQAQSQAFDTLTAALLREAFDGRI
jgi:type I restriction enzyme S subunit